MQVSFVDYERRTAVREHLAAIDSDRRAVMLGPNAVRLCIEKCIFLKMAQICAQTLFMCT